MIGQTLYIYDSNRERRSLTGEAKHRSAFIPVLITGETSHSWTGELHGRQIRFGKRTMQVGGYTGPAVTPIAYTAEHMEREVFIRSYRHLLARAVQDCNDIEVLKQIKVLFDL